MLKFRYLKSTCTTDLGCTGWACRLLQCFQGMQENVEDGRREDLLEG